MTVWFDEYLARDAWCFLANMFSDGRVNEPMPQRAIGRRWVVVLIVGFTLLLMFFVGGLYFVNHSSKFMHPCWDGTSAEICPPSGVSQGNP